MKRNSCPAFTDFKLKVLNYSYYQEVVWEHLEGFACFISKNPLERLKCISVVWNSLCC